MNKIIIANWKMNPATEKEAEKLLRLTKKQLPILKDKTIVVCPPFPYLFLYKISNPKSFYSGSKCFNRREGSYTGKFRLECSLV
jgi:triosephosphate isomerase